MTEYITVWECIGCGRIEASQPCVGVCQDRKTEFVYAQDYEKALRSAEKIARDLNVAKGLLEQLAKTKPRAGQWERCFLAFRSRAEQALVALAQDEPETSAAPADAVVSPRVSLRRGQTGDAAP